MLKQIKIIANGICKGFKGAGGWSATMVYKKIAKTFNGNDKATTTHRINLTAICEALRHMKEPCEITIETNSLYIYNAIANGWVERWAKNDWMRNKYNKAKNADLWAEYMKLSKIHKIHITCPNAPALTAAA